MSEQESNATESPPPSPLNTSEAKDAERAVAAIMTGVKNYAVFPPDHASTVNLIQGILRAVHQFSEKYGSLGFEVERNSLFFREKSVYDGPASDDNPAFVLYRAGISRFEFQPGLEEEELVTFFQVYNHYRVIADEPDDDLVSALWRVGLPHIFYEASYELWSDAETALDLDNMATVDPAERGGPEVVESPGQGWEALRPASDSDEYVRLSLALTPEGREFPEFSGPEEEKLAEMAGEELAVGGSEGAVRLVFFLLEQESEPQGHEAALGFLQETFLNYFLQHNFRRAYFILDNIRKNFLAARESKTWALPAYKKFYAAIIRPEILARVVAVGPGFAELDAMEIKSLAALFQQLPSRAAQELVVLLPRVESDEARQVFVEIILHFARRITEILPAALASEIDDLVLGAINIIKESQDRGLAEQHLQNFRYDSRSRIRQEASRILASHGIY